MKKVVQFGRSMIEMLGVLAIIAVISIGGLTLYRRAMDTYKANNIFDDVNRFEVVILERINQTESGQISQGDFAPTSGFEMDATNESEERRHFISVYDVTSGVCQIVLNKGAEKYTMFANNLLYEGKDICQETNEMRFYFGNVDNLCSKPKEGSNQVACSDNCLCSADEGKSCKSDIYPGFNQTKCCRNDEVNCFRTCRPACPAGMAYNDRCQCECTDPMKEYNAAQGKCVCKTSGSSVALVEDSNGNCGCADNTYAWVNSLGKCSKLSCTNEGGTCSLDDKRCGKKCTNTNNINSISCNDGICRPSLCSSDQYFELTPKTMASGYYWGCRLGNTSCYKRKDAYFFCFNDSSQIPHECCLTYTPGICDYMGSCDPLICEQFEEKDAAVVYGDVNSTGGCLFSNGVKCRPTNADASKWSCYPASGGTECATNCTTPPNCGVCTDTCGGQGKVDGDYCCVTHGTDTICRKESDYYFKNGTTYNLCGNSCTYTGLAEQNDGTYTITSISCKKGSCQTSACSSGWSYGKAGSYWGCVKNENPNLYCFKNNSEGPYNCSCGRYCSTIDNSDCMLWLAKPCAPSVTREVNGISVTKPACIYGRVQGTIDVDDYDYDCWCQGDVDEATNICCSPGQFVRGGECVSQ